MEELLEYEEQCNISISFFKFQDHYSKEIKIKAYHVGDPVHFFVRRYFVEDASSPCFFYDYLSNEIQPLIDSLSSIGYRITQPKGNVITADNINHATEQTWNFSVQRQVHLLHAEFV